MSVSTASAALNNKPFVSPQTRARVLQAALELNYHVNRMARNLAMGRTFQIGLLIPALLEHTFSASHFFNQLMRGIYGACRPEDYSLVLFAVENEDDLTRQMTHWAHGRSVDGFIITHPTWEMPYREVLEQSGLPYVVIGRPPDKDASRVLFVDNDNVQVAYDATAYLLARGHRRILFVNGPSRYTYAHDRNEGYRRALHTYGVPVDERLLVEAELTFVDGYRVVDALCGQVTFSAVVVLNPMQALGVMHALAKHGCRVPEDVAAITTDCEMAKYMHPPLTAVDIQPYQLGYHAATILLQLLAGEPTAPRIIPHALVERASTRRMVAQAHR